MNDFETMVNEHRQRLYSFARRIVRNSEDAEEVVQDAFVRAHRALIKMQPFNRRTLRLESWLYRITLNVARNRLRKKAPVFVCIDAIEDPERLLPPQSAEQTPESHVEEQVNRELLEAAISKLPHHFQASARLRFIEGLTHTEIAQHFGQPVGTVKSHVHRATLVMRQSLRVRLCAT